MGTYLTPSMPIGRFAPSPTGHLHLGSLITAVASYCAIRALDGQWLVRIEDTDWERCRPAYSDSILRELARLGLHWDGEVRYQSQHLTAYQGYLEQALLPVTYGCDCTRKQLSQLALPHYPQFCVHKHLDRNNYAVRLVMPDTTIGFLDQLQGMQWQNPQQTLGDVVIKRQNGMINYMLAVVIDDALQEVTHIIRGIDILPLTIPQLVLADYLRVSCPQAFYHLPIVVDTQGEKLSKQTLAEPTYPYPAPALLTLILRLLQQPNVESDIPEIMLAQAINQWDFSPLVGKKTVCLGNKLTAMLG